MGALALRTLPPAAASGVPSPSPSGEAGAGEAAMTPRLGMRVVKGYAATSGEARVMAASRELLPEKRREEEEEEEEEGGMGVVKG